MQTLEQKYEENMQALGEEKKEKLETLYKQLVSCGENLDTCKDLMETIEDLDQGDNRADIVMVRELEKESLIKMLSSFFVVFSLKIRC